jgi:hypothetical protein
VQRGKLTKPKFIGAVANIPETILQHRSTPLKGNATQSSVVPHISGFEPILTNLYD